VQPLREVLAPRLRRSPRAHAQAPAHRRQPRAPRGTPVPHRPCCGLRRRTPQLPPARSCPQRPLPCLWAYMQRLPRPSPQRSARPLRPLKGGRQTALRPSYGRPKSGRPLTAAACRAWPCSRLSRLASLLARRQRAVCRVGARRPLLEQQRAQAARAAAAPLAHSCRRHPSVICQQDLMRCRKDAAAAAWRPMPAPAPAAWSKALPCRQRRPARLWQEKSPRAAAAAAAAARGLL